MKISEIQARQGKIDVEAEVVSKDEPKEFEKFGKKGQSSSKDEERKKATQRNKRLS